MKPGLVNEYWRLGLVAVIAVLAGCGGDSSSTADSTEPAPRADATAPAREGAAVAADPGAVSALDVAADPEAVPVLDVAADADAVPEPGKATDLPRGAVVRETDLKASPDVAARTIAMLPASSVVTLLERQGGWYRVQTQDGEGWVRILHVSRSPERTGSTIAREIDAVAGIATGRSGSGNVAATTGIRGFDEEDLRLATPDMAALQRVDNFAVTRARAAEEARARGLVARRIDYLPGPQK